MQIWDSKQQQKIKINDLIVTMYVCGPTVYGDIHIGNMRPIVIFDILQRLFMVTKQKVFYVQNITDIDDKIIHQAHLEKITEKELTEKYTKSYFEVLKQLNVYEPNLFVKVSDNIADIIKFIERLVKIEAAYVKNGNVYLAIEKYFQSYGQLSKKNLKDLQVGIRVAIDSNKNYVNDFVLWKKTDQGQKWTSPWSEGRPGWHTECALFINKYFKHPINIHGGGIDLIFPHHENERIQLLALNKQEPVKIWLHNGHLFYDDVKMSKSLKNTIVVKEFLHHYDANILRYLLTLTHYSKPLNITKNFIMQGKEKVAKIHQILKESLVIAFLNGEVNTNEKNEQLVMQVVNYLQDDLNFANAWVIIEQIIKEINNILKGKLGAILPLFNTLQQCLFLLGLQFSLVSFDDDVKQLLLSWQNARKQKKYNLADKIREQLQAKNIL